MMIQTYSGGFFDLKNPLKSEINVIDIAHSLSMQCRFNGHSRVFYSVAEHSVLVSRLTQGSIIDKMAGLLHDSPEIITADIPTPVKHFFIELPKIEHDILDAIIQLIELDFDGVNWDEIEKWDRFMVMYEALLLLNPCRKHKMIWGPWINMYQSQMDQVRKLLKGEQDDSIYKEFSIQALSPVQAKEEFIGRFNELRWQL